ncbi:hypothetical protein IE077_002230 [Cardiosporidium cionae]|uniref:t-SNARE coiled-coil homology domain-containing protein n=1 Tax=Cardiosporidium cionae TaxID=476202 RepID=A0ABQ7JGS6_9APIC|nr:hypothetical protein IE077_002230 [Cardiosporidium cionae]|eukprot:KAF8822895.1 hypothetical protein IE077_002230 [Cardiosporidium cionae]
MNLEADQLVEDLNSLLDELKSSLNSFKHLSVGEKKKQILYSAKVAQQIRTTKEAILIEIRSMNTDEADVYTQKLKDATGVYLNLMGDLEWRKSEMRRDRVLEQAEQGGDVKPDEMNREEVVSFGDKIQDKTQESLDRMKHYALESEQIGADIILKLDDQGERIEALKSEVEKIDSNIAHAKRTARSIAKNVASDRCVQILVVVVIFLFIGVLVVLFLPGKTRVVAAS